ncbi:MAG: MFS transporter [Chloroflexi bacterium]|nr:MFS transporter [Chloroflexota bacterium]
MKNLRTFYTLVITQIFSLIGSRMTGIGVGLWVFDRTGNASPLLIAAFFAELPGMALGTFTGLLADRWERRHVIILGDIGQAAASCILLTSFLTHSFELWHLYLAMLIQGIFGVIQSPASQAAITMLVPEDQRDRANGIKQIGFPLAGVIAPVLAGLVYREVGLAGVIAIDLTTFLIAVVVVTQMTIPRPLQSTESQTLATSFWREMAGGWLFLKNRKMLLLMVTYLALIYFLINGPLELAIPYFSTLVNNDAIIGLLLGVMSLGAFAGALTIAVVGKVPHRLYAILLGYLMHGLCLILFGLVRHPILLGLSIFWVMFPLPLTGALFHTLLQTKTPPDMQGRVFAVTDQLFMLTTPLSFLITGALVDKVLEPAVGTSAWQLFTPLLGNQAGAGMGLLLVIIGLLISIATLIMLALHGIRHLETDLPSYAALAENENDPS